MKTLKIFIALTVVSIQISYAQFTKAELQVSGLTCSLCSKATEKSLRTLGFITDIKADLNRNVFVLTFKNDVPVDFDLITKKVQSAGFFVNNLKVTFNFQNVSIANNRFTYAGDTFDLVAPANKPLNGPIDMTIVDKGFAPAAVYKKYSSVIAGAPNKSGHVYHVVI